MILLLALNFFLFAAAAQEFQVCDCANSTSLGLLKFSDTTCEPKLEVENIRHVYFAVFRDQRDSEIIAGHLCSRWRRIKRITTNLFGQTIEVNDKISLETSAEACKVMHETKKCEGIPMESRDGKWILNLDPKGSGSWLRTVEFSSISCAYEEIELAIPVDEQILSTPVGYVNVTVGHLSRNHVTITWDSTKRNLNHPHEIAEGFGTLTNSSQPNTYLLRNASIQTSYHVYNETKLLDVNCNGTKTMICHLKKKYELSVYGFNLFKVVGSPHLIIALQYGKQIASGSKNAKIEFKYNLHAGDIEGKIVDPTLYDTGDTNEAAKSIYQFQSDRLTDEENYLARELRIAQCDIRKAKHAQALSTAQFNGWLAASQLKLPNCVKLIATGETVVALKCSAKLVNFTSEMTKCGPQPRYKNYTINIDGWELVNFVPCLWNVGYVNFNNEPYVYDNGKWIRYNATVIVPERDLAHDFRYENVNFFEHYPRSNPAHQVHHLSPMNVLADLASAMNEYSTSYVRGFSDMEKPGLRNLVVSTSEDRSNLIQNLDNFWSGFGLWSWFKMIFGIVITLIVFLLVVRCGCLLFDDFK